MQGTNGHEFELGLNAEDSGPDVTPNSVFCLLKKSGKRISTPES